MVTEEFQEGELESARCLEILLYVGIVEESADYLKENLHTDYCIHFSGVPSLQDVSSTSSIHFLSSRLLLVIGHFLFWLYS